jgi:hypothetical protein
MATRAERYRYEVERAADKPKVARRLRKATLRKDAGPAPAARSAKGGGRRDHQKSAAPMTGRQQLRLASPRHRHDEATYPQGGPPRR